MMSRFLSDEYARWAGGAGLGALVVLAWAVLGPGGLFWNAVAAAGVAGATIATVVLVRSRAQPSLAQVIATARATSQRDAVATRERP
jgi:hypothetical protein